MTAVAKIVKIKLVNDCFVLHIEPIKVLSLDKVVLKKVNIKRKQIKSA